MKPTGEKSSKRFWIIVFLIGVVLESAYLLSLHQLEKHIYWYDAPGGESAYEGTDKTDPALVWMMRSKEYHRANENAKRNMRHDWAVEYTDRHIGRFVRIAVLCLLLAIPIMVALASYFE